MKRVGLMAGMIGVSTAGLALWVLLSERGGRAAELLTPRVRAEPQGEQAGRITSLPAAGASVEEIPGLQVSPENESRRQTLTAVEDLPKRIESTLLIVDGTSGDPLPGARVRWADLVEIHRFRSSQVDRRGWTEATVVEQIGRLDVADASGFIRVPGELGAGWFTAHHGELSATDRRIFMHESRVTTPTEERISYGTEALLLFPDRALEIQVVDSQGRPREGIEVCLRVAGLPFQSEIWRGTTRAEDGIARIEHTDSLLEQFYEWARMGKHGELFADFGFATRPPVNQRIDPLRWPQEPIQLELPGIGSLRVTVLDQSGQPTTERVKVYVDATDPGEALTSRIGEGDVDNGSIRFGSIQYGLRLAVSVSFYGRRDSIRREIAGPDSYQQDLELTVHESAPTPLITARPMDSKGQPIVSRAVLFRFVSRNAHGDTLSSGSQALMTDSSGRFEAQLLTALYPQGSCSIRLSYDGYYTERELTADLAFEHIELGDLRLDREEEEQ